jgi:hypothetical protein
MSQVQEISAANSLSGSERLRFYARKLQRHPALKPWKRSTRVLTSLLPSTWRRATQRFRQLPTVIIAGAQKAGTTQLYAYLTTHPQLFPASCKEVNYFTTHCRRPVEWYRSQFPFRYRVEAAHGRTIEASPSYLAVPSALRQLRTVLPDTRIVAVLRDPVARAFSHYQHEKTRGRESRSFAQAVNEELRENSLPPEFGIALRADARPQLGYVARGYYALQLELLLDLFPQQHVLVIDSADLFEDTAGTCRRVFEFLELEPQEIRLGKVYNRGYYQERIEPIVAERLRDHYRPYDGLLAELLGRRFSWTAPAKPIAA